MAVLTPVTARGVNAPKRKKGKRKGPTGLYQGKAGEFAAQQNPEAYIGVQSNKAGLGTTGGTEYANWFADQGLRDIYSGGYQNALAQNERLSLRDYMKQAGRGNLGAQLNQEFQHYSSTNNPQDYWAGYMADRPEMKAAGAGGFYHDFLANNWFNKKFADYKSGTNAQPNMSFDEFLQGYEDPESEIVSGSGTYHSGKGKGRKKGRR